jgi:hypothetical protein
MKSAKHSPGIPTFMTLICSHTRAQVSQSHLEAFATARLFAFRVVHVCKTSLRHGTFIYIPCSSCVQDKIWRETAKLVQLALVHILHHQCYLAAYAKVLPKNQRIPQEGMPIQKKCAPKGNGGKQQYCANHTSRVHSFLLSCVTGGTWATVTP